MPTDIPHVSFVSQSEFTTTNLSTWLHRINEGSTTAGYGLVFGRGESLCPEGGEGVSLVLRVDREHHAFATVTGLSAVEPERFLVRPDFGTYDLLFRMFGAHGFEARVKAVVQLGAWEVKRGLSH